MKRYLSLILSALLTLFIFSFQNAPAYALGKSAWEKEYITDAFGDPTEEYCLSNCKVFNGTYNSASISKGKLSVDLFVQRKGYGVQAFVVLFLDGKDQLKNGTNSQVDYAITIKGTDGKKTNTIGTMLSNTDRIEIYNPVSLADALSSGKGQVSVYIEENGQTLNNFLFEADCGNFGKLYEQEILIPIKDDYYSYAESLLQLRRYDEAAAAFEELGEYRDSAARVTEALGAKNAESYAQAEELLHQGKYDEAITVFTGLGDYSDSKARIAEVYEAQKADAYAKAEELLRQKRYDDAIAAFTELGDYSDSKDRIAEAYEAQKADVYAKAEELLRQKRYDDAIAAFTELGDYSDSKDRIAEAQEEKREDLYDRAIQLVASKDYDAALPLFNEIKGYKDSSERIEFIQSALNDMYCEYLDLAYAAAEHDLNSAGEYLGMIPDSYSPAKSLREIYQRYRPYFGTFVLMQNSTESEKFSSVFKLSNKDSIKWHSVKADDSFHVFSTEKMGLDEWTEVISMDASVEFINDSGKAIKTNVHFGDNVISITTTNTLKTDGSSLSYTAVPKQ